MSVTGPQKRLTQYVGVETTSTTGRFSVKAWATVVRCRSASGTGVLADARESIDSGAAPGEFTVRFWVAGAGSPGAGTACLGRTLKAVLTSWGPPRSTTAATPQKPGLSKATLAAYTPRWSVER